MLNYIFFSDTYNGKKFKIQVEEENESSKVGPVWCQGKSRSNQLERLTQRQKERKIYRD